jgi:hypothetical protein
MSKQKIFFIALIAFLAPSLYGMIVRNTRNFYSNISGKYANPLSPFIYRHSVSHPIIQKSIYATRRTEPTNDGGSSKQSWFNRWFRTNRVDSEKDTISTRTIDALIKEREEVQELIRQVVSEFSRLDVADKEPEMRLKLIKVYNNLKTKLNQIDKELESLNYQKQPNEQVENSYKE